MVATQDLAAATRCSTVAIRFVAGVIGCCQNRYLYNLIRTAEDIKAATHLPSTLTPAPHAWLVACPYRQRAHHRRETASSNLHLTKPFQKPSTPYSQHGSMWAGCIGWWHTITQALRSIFQATDERPVLIVEHTCWRQTSAHT